MRGSSDDTDERFEAIEAKRIGAKGKVMKKGLIHDESRHTRQNDHTSA